MTRTLQRMGPSRKASAPASPRCPTCGSAGAPAHLRLATPAPAVDAVALVDLLAQLLAPRIMELLAHRAAASELVDVLSTVPGPRRSIMSACRRGAIVGAVRVGRRWLAPRASLDRWLQDLGPRTVAPVVDDEDELEPQRTRLDRGWGR